MLRGSSCGGSIGPWWWQTFPYRPKGDENLLYVAYVYHMYAYVLFLWGQMSFLVGQCVDCRSSRAVKQRHLVSLTILGYVS